MPFNGKVPAADMTAAAKLLYLADFLETLELGQIDMRTVHHACGTVHCAWGWGEIIGLFPRSGGPEDDSEWNNEMLSAENGQSNILGLTDKQFRYCFGIGYQFRALNRRYTPADIARHLRYTAAELDDQPIKRPCPRFMAQSGIS